VTYDELTPDQRQLHDDLMVSAGSFQECVDLLREADARAEDKAAVAEVFGGPGAGKEFQR
jgi:adenine/guanine phosphoribosyltransferase-like PRPP-binding protein